MPPRTIHRTLALFGVLREREIRALWLSQSVSDAGSFVTFIALAVYVHDLAGTAAAVGFALALRSIAGFLFGPFSGILADRFDRRVVLVTCDLARAALVGVLPFTTSVWQAYALAFASAAVAPLYRAARTAFVPEVAAPGKLVPALTMSEATHHLLHTVGPALGGLVVLLVGARGGFVVDAASFVLSAAIVSTVRSRGRARQAHASALMDFWEGASAVFKASAVRTYALVNAALAFSGAGIVALLVVYVRDVLREPAGHFGLVLAVAGLGTVLTTLVIAVRDERHPRTPWAFASAAAGSVFLVALGHPHLPLLLAMGFVLGLQDGGIDVPYSATTAETLANEVRGRAAAASEGFGELFFAAGSIIFAWLGDPARVGVTGALALAGGSGTVLAMLVLAAGGTAAIARSERLRLPVASAEGAPSRPPLREP